MFKKIRMFIVGLWRLTMEGFEWMGRKIKQGFKAMGRGIAKACMWLLDLPYRAMGMHVMRRIGKGLHKILFSFLLPKKYRNATKEQLFSLIFKSDTKSGRKFDIWLMVLIALNILVLIMESTTAVQRVVWLRWTMVGLEWLFTIMFTFEYYLRIYCLKQPMKYVTSFYGIIDFFSIFPAYLGLFIPAARTFVVLRLLRLLRIFVVLDMKTFMRESRALLSAMWRSATKILIFMLFVYIMAVILGSVMYMVESKVNPNVFHSIPSGIYWAVVTLTTVGYGNVTPITPTGRFIAMVVMILGYSMIAVPTGIVAGETIEEHRRQREAGKRNINIKREDTWLESKLNPKLEPGEDPKDDVEGEVKQKKPRKKLFGRKKARKAAEEAERQALMKPDVEVVYPKQDPTPADEDMDEDMSEDDLMEEMEEEMLPKRREVEVVMPKMSDIPLSKEEPENTVDESLSEDSYMNEVKRTQQEVNDEGNLDDLLNLLDHEPKDNDEK